MCVSLRPLPSRAHARGFLSLLALLIGGRAVAPPDAHAAEQTFPPHLVATDALVGLADGATVRWYNHQGQRLGQLPAGPGAHDGNNGEPTDRGAGAAADADAAERAGSARERLLDSLDIPDELRDRDDALDLAEDDLSLSLRSQERAARTPRAAAPDPHPAAARAFVLVDGAALIAVADRRIWRIEPGRPAQPVGVAPAGLTAMAATGRGLWLAARGTEILASRDEGRRFTVVDRLPTPPEQLVVDPGGGFFAAAGPGRLDVVRFARDGRSVQRLRFEPRVGLRDLAICGGKLAVLADDGLHLVAPDGLAEPVTPARTETHLACASDPGSGVVTWLLYGRNGLAIFRDPGAAAGQPPRQGRRLAPVAAATFPIEAAGSAGPRIWIFSRIQGLIELGPDGSPPLQVGSIDDASIGRPAGDAPLRASPWRGLLPHLSLTGRQSHDSGTGRRAIAVALVADWRLGPTPARPEEPRTPPPGPPMASPLPGFELGAGPPGAPLARTADPEGPCLARARAHAVVLAAAEPEHARSLVTRAGRSAWLPELRLRAERRVGRSESLDYKPTASSDALGLDTDSAVRYEVRATWDLPRLVFNPEEIGAAAQALRINEMRREIESQVNRLYYERRRLVAAAPAAPGEDAATWQIRIEELEADLDALSGGSFARCLAGPTREVP